MDWAREQPGYAEDEQQLFEKVRNLVRWHYQWLVVHDYLKTVCLPGVVDKVLLGGNKHFMPPPDDNSIYMPLEFSAAAFRFGHSMVRGFYDFNRNFGRKDGGPGVLLPFAKFGFLFAFTGSARPAPFNNGGTTVLPFNWVIEWDRFVDKGDSRPDHFARKIDTQLAPPLFDMINQISKHDESLPIQIQDILRRLAVRNLLRGYQLALPTGQAVAEALKVPALTEAELRQGNSTAVNDALIEGGFLTRRRRLVVLRPEGGRGEGERQLARRGRQPDRRGDHHRADPRRPGLVPQAGRRLESGGGSKGGR